jgi:hypothetical protein
MPLRRALLLRCLMLLRHCLWPSRRQLLSRHLLLSCPLLLRCRLLLRRPLLLRRLLLLHCKLPVVCQPQLEAHAFANCQRLGFLHAEGLTTGTPEHLHAG